MRFVVRSFTWHEICDQESHMALCYEICTRFSLIKWSFVRVFGQLVQSHWSEILRHSEPSENRAQVSKNCNVAFLF